jgi:hypothetical protein
MSEFECLEAGKAHRDQLLDAVKLLSPRDNDLALSVTLTKSLFHNSCENYADIRLIVFWPFARGFIAPLALAASVKLFESSNLTATSNIQLEDMSIVP